MFLKKIPPNFRFPLSASLYVDNILFFKRRNLRNLEKSNPGLCSKQFTFQTRYAKTSLHKNSKSSKPNMHGHLQTSKEIFVLLDNQPGTGITIHLSNSVFILSSLKARLPGTVPWVFSLKMCSWSLLYCSIRKQQDIFVYILLSSVCMTVSQRT